MSQLVSVSWHAEPEQFSGISTSRAQKGPFISFSELEVSNPISIRTSTEEKEEIKEENS